MLPLGEYLPRITPADAMVIVFDAIKSCGVLKMLFEAKWTLFSAHQSDEMCRKVGRHFRVVTVDVQL
jgi:hypothetical protein